MCTVVFINGEEKYMKHRDTTDAPDYSGAAGRPVQKRSVNTITNRSSRMAPVAALSKENPLFVAII